MFAALALSASALLTCQADGILARSVMIARQSGQFTQAQTLAIIRDSPEVTHRHKVIGTLMVHLAYDMPLRASDDTKTLEIQKFEDAAVRACVRHHTSP